MLGEKSLEQSWRFVDEAFQVHVSGGVNFAKRHLEGTGGSDVNPVLDLQTPRGRYEKALEPLGGQQAKESEACGNGPGARACREAVIKKYDNIRCNESEKAYLDWRPNMLRLDGAVEDHFDEAYKLMTGLAANLNDPVSHEMALLRIEAYTDYLLRFYVLMPAITPKFSPLFAYVALCKEPGTPEAIGPADLKVAAKCDLVSGSNKVSVDLLVAGVSFNCEKVSLEVSKGQLVQGFVEVEYEFSGKLTVTIGGGLGVEAGPVNVGVKGGCYVSVDTGTGSFVDAGIKGSAGATTSGSVGATSELEGTISFIAG